MKLYLYAKGHCIKRLNIPQEENPFNSVYVITVYWKKYLLGTNKAKIVVQPKKLKYKTDTEIHAECEMFEGVAE